MTDISPETRNFADEPSRIIRDDPDKKVHLMMSYTGRSRDVADSWYTGDFEQTFQDILAGCGAMLRLGI